MSMYYENHLHLHFIGCECSSEGSESLQCDANGQCTCKPGFDGLKCDECAANYYGYPSCQGLYSPKYFYECKVYFFARALALICLPVAPFVWVRWGLLRPWGGWGCFFLISLEYLCSFVTLLKLQPFVLTLLTQFFWLNFWHVLHLCGTIIVIVLFLIVIIESWKLE